LIVSFPLHTARPRCYGAISGERNLMKRPYELTFIVRIDSSEEVMNETVQQVKGWVETSDLGKVNKIDRWGRRKLAYEIDKQREGYYVLFEADIDTKNLPELERNLKLSSSILRYLLVRPD
jgi:small subunit ribosomal protein S6